MVDFSFIVSLYVSELRNVTISMDCPTFCIKPLPPKYKENLEDNE